MRAGDQPGRRRSQGCPPRPGAAGPATCFPRASSRFGSIACPTCAADRASRRSGCTSARRDDGDRFAARQRAVDPGSGPSPSYSSKSRSRPTWGQPFVVRGSRRADSRRRPGPAAGTRKIRRRHIEVLERIEKLWTGDDASAPAPSPGSAATVGFAGTDLVRDAAVPPGEVAEVIERLHNGPQAHERSVNPIARFSCTAIYCASLEERVSAPFGQLHEESPADDDARPQKRSDRTRLRRTTMRLVQATVDRLSSRRSSSATRKRSARADFKPKLSGQPAEAQGTPWSGVSGASFQPPDAGELRPQAAGNAANLRDLFDVCVAEGELIHITDDIYLHTTAEAKMRQAGRRAAEERRRARPLPRSATCSARRGSSRCPLCEYLDRVR